MTKHVERKIGNSAFFQRPGTPINFPITLHLSPPSSPAFPARRTPCATMALLRTTGEFAQNRGFLRPPLAHHWRIHRKTAFRAPRLARTTATRFGAPSASPRRTLLSPPPFAAPPQS